jgi:predicted acyl esterase
MAQTGAVSTPSLEAETEITGPMAAKLYVSSASADADLFLLLRVFEPGGEEVTFHGANAPNAPIAQGWLRASHRKLDRELSWRSGRAASWCRRATGWR